MLRILAKPKHGRSNLINDRFYHELESLGGIQVIDWSPFQMLIGRYDVLHVHWPDNILSERRWVVSFLKFLLLMTALCWTKVRGKKLVWTAHNIVSHDGRYPRLEVVFWKAFFHFVNGIIALSEESLDKLKQLRRGADGIDSVVIPHGNYCGVYPDDVTREESRKELGIPNSSKVLLSLGLIRKYKNIEKLLDVAAQEPSIFVLIAGRVPEKAYQETLINQAKELKNVRIDIGFIADDWLQYYFKASDVFVLPYNKITNSGSAILSLSYNIPVIAPDLPCFKALQKDFGSEWVVTYDSVFAPEIIDGFFRREIVLDSVSWGDWDWGQIAKRVKAFYEGLI